MPDVFSSQILANSTPMMRAVEVTQRVDV